MIKQKLILDQIDRKVLQFKKLDELTVPSSGWVFAIRQALGMSMKQLGKRMGITAQSIKEIEDREKNGTISMNVLKQFGKSLDMKLIYGFIPAEKNLSAIIEKRAIEIAEEIVLRASVTMKLEDQENTKKRIKKAIKEKSEEIIIEMPRYLWD